MNTPQKTRQDISPAKSGNHQMNNVRTEKKSPPQQVKSKEQPRPQQPKYKEQIQPQKQDGHVNKSGESKKAAGKTPVNNKAKQK
jgi:hypothetical protein